MNALLETIANSGSEKDVTAAAEKVSNINGSDDELPSNGVPRPLTAAVLSKNIPAMRALLSIGAKTELYCTVPDESAILAELTTTEDLRAMIWTPNEYRRFGNVVHRTETPLLTASRLGLLEACQLLLEYGANPTTRSLDCQMTSLHYAASKGHFGIVQLLVDKGCPRNLTSCYNFTPLTEAVINTHYAVVQYLAQNGADLNSETEDDQTPLYLAMVIQDENIASYLVRAGCDLRLYSHYSGEHRDEILTLALTSGLYKLSRFLVLAGCRLSVSHVDMVVKQEYASQDFISWISDLKLSGAMTLKRQCRIAIRNRLKVCLPSKDVLRRINQLPLPKLLRDYLTFEVL